MSYNASAWLLLLGLFRTRQVGLHLIAFALVMTATIYLIIDLDYPRYGIIRVDFADKALEDVLARMK